MNTAETILEKRILDLIHRTACTLPVETLNAMKAAYEREDEDSIGRINLSTNLMNLDLSENNQIPMCADTGFPVFFVRIGDVQGVNLVTVEKAICRAVERATRLAFIRPTVVDPISRKNPGTNVGKGSPVIDYKVDPAIDYCEIIYAPKGGGTEIFGPAFRTILVADGIKGIKKFVFDSLIVDGNKTGATCPPNVVGVGVGGTSDSCMLLAKQAACLRKIGSRNPDPRIRELEDELLEVINATGIGPLGMGGRTTALDVHIEISLTHLVGTPIAMVLQCPAARVGTLRISANGALTEVDWPGWFSY
jgi:fumarate hydratase subunit alpha